MAANAVCVCNWVYFRALLMITLSWNIYIAYMRHYSTKCLSILFLIYSSFPFPFVILLKLRDTIWQIVRTDWYVWGLFVSIYLNSYIWNFVDGCRVSRSRHLIDQHLLQFKLFYGYSFILLPFQFSFSSNAILVLGWVTYFIIAVVARFNHFEILLITHLFRWKVFISTVVFSVLAQILEISVFDFFLGIPVNRWDWIIWVWIRGVVCGTTVVFF